ncbi:MAG: hypothetical protein ACLFPQ_05630 [Candidatus Woesearchaeota archaeon]
MAEYDFSDYDEFDANCDEPIDNSLKAFRDIYHKISLISDEDRKKEAALGLMSSIGIKIDSYMEEHHLSYESLDKTMAIAHNMGVDSLEAEVRGELAYSAHNLRCFYDLLEDIADNIFGRELMDEMIGKFLGLDNDDGKIYRFVNGELYEVVEPPYENPDTIEQEVADKMIELNEMNDKDESE